MSKVIYKIPKVLSIKTGYQLLINIIELDVKIVVYFMFLVS